MKKESILEEARRIVHGERGENYGHPFEDFSRTAKIWSAIMDIEVTPEQVALCMIGVKISREVNRPKRDNIVDGAGYFETLDMVKKERIKGLTLHFMPYQEIARLDTVERIKKLLKIIITKNLYQYI